MVKALSARGIVGMTASNVKGAGVQGGKLAAISCHAMPCHAHGDTVMVISDSEAYACGCALACSIVQCTLSTASGASP